MSPPPSPNPGNGNDGSVGPPKEGESVGGMTSGISVGGTTSSLLSSRFSSALPPPIRLSLVLSVSGSMVNPSSSPSSPIVGNFWVVISRPSRVEIWALPKVLAALSNAAKNVSIVSSLGLIVVMLNTLMGLPKLSSVTNCPCSADLAAASTLDTCTPTKSGHASTNRAI